jgi:hypothetical protein
MPIPNALVLGGHNLAFEHGTKTVFARVTDDAPTVKKLAIQLGRNSASRLAMATPT